MVSRPDVLRIWARQLEVGDFPPVCAVTGLPADTWRRFRIWKPWSRAAPRADGHLPMTASAAKVIAGLEIAFGFLGPAILLNAASFFIARAYRNDPDLSAIALTFGIIGLLLTAVGLTGLVIRRYFVGPLGDIQEAPPGYSDRVIEIHRVHPAFVAATNQMYAARAAQPSRPS